MKFLGERVDESKFAEIYQEKYVILAQDGFKAYRLKLVESPIITLIRNKKSARTLILISTRVISFNKCSTYFNKSSDKSILKTFCSIYNTLRFLLLQLNFSSCCEKYVT